MQVRENIGQLDEDVVGQDDRVRNDDPLVRRVGEVPLVPEDHVLERAGGRTRGRARARDVTFSESIGLRFWAIVELPT